MIFRQGIALALGLFVAQAAASEGASDAVDLGRTVVSVYYPERLEIPLPGQGFYELNHDLKDALNRKLTESGQFLVLEDSESDAQSLLRQRFSALRQERSGYEWASHPVASLDIHLQVPEISFRTGARGDRTLYGWDERMQDPFVLHPEWGIRPGTNEFESLPSDSRDRGGIRSRFARHFDPNDGREWIGSYSGLDLSEGLSLNFLLAYMKIILRTYTARVVFEVQAREQASGQWQSFRVPAQTSGFYFDIAAGYLGYSGGLMAARKDAMTRAVQKTVDLAAQELSLKLRRTTRVAVLEGLLPDPEAARTLVFLGTGPLSRIPEGVIFVEPQTGLRVAITSLPTSSGSVGQVLSQGASLPVVGSLLYEESSLRNFTRGLASQQSARDRRNDSDSVRSGDALPQESSEAVQQVEKKENLTGLDFSGLGIEEKSDIELFFKSIAGAVLLPYRIYRWWKYDQSYHREPDAVLSGKGEIRSLKAWVDHARKSPWAKQIGLPAQEAFPSKVVRNPVVALLDSGVDYNHPVLHGSMDLRESAPADRWGQRERVGWDYISGDPKPFDENDHGTELASLILAVAPHARILPLKVFNAWGMTSSQALYSAFAHAVERKVDVILLGASTPIDAHSLKAAIQLAAEAGIPVVVPAGDEGMNLDDPARHSFPASWARESEFLLPVVAMDRRGQRFGEGVHDPRKVRSNFASHGGLPLAAPGDALSVVRPRARLGAGEGTSYSAALVAGALLRELSTEDWPQTREAKIQQGRAVIATVLTNAKRSTQLEKSVEQGRSLWIAN